MKKLGIIVLSLILLISVVMTSCNKNTPTTKVTSQNSLVSKTESAAESVATAIAIPRPLKGTIKISQAFNTFLPVWNEIAKEYMKLNPEVKVILDEKDGGTYAEWLSMQLSGGTPEADLVVTNEVAQFFSENKFVDLTNYLNRPNFYNANAPWIDNLMETAYQGGASGPNGESYQINVDSVMTCFFYNEDIFKKVGISVPKNWDELIVICEKLKKAGYIPIALPGNAEAFSSWMMSWLFRVYADQYFRDMEGQWQMVEGDYGFDEELFSTWKYNKDDPNNDNNIARFNQIRMAAMMREGKIGTESVKFKEMLNNLLKVIPKYTQDGFTGTEYGKALQYFVKGEAAMTVENVSFAVNYDRVMANNTDKKFKLGNFIYPPMTGKNVGVSYTRTVGGSNGYMSAINKSQEQNDLNVDFLMFYASKMGQDVRYKAMEKINFAPQGPSLVKGVELPEFCKKVYESLGNPGFADNNFAAAIGFGWHTSKGSRSFQDNGQLLFSGKMSVDQYSAKLQKDIVDNLPLWLKIEGYNADALDNPTKNPAK